MRFWNAFTSLPVLIGGSLIALLAAIWGLVLWDIPHWFLAVVSIPFIFTAAIAQDFRVYVFIVSVYIVSHIGINIWSADESFITSSDLFQWFSILVSAEVIYIISSQRRKADDLSQRRIRELEALNQTLANISSELNLGSLLQIILEQAVKLLRASLGELLLYDKKTGEMEIVAQYPASANQVGFKMKPGEGAMGRVAVTKRPLLLNNYKAFVNALDEEVTSNVEATLDVPLLRGDDLVGVLGVAHHSKTDKFTLDDQSLLIVLAGQATVAIENAKLYKEVQHLAFTDGLTGVNNRRRLFEIADKEFKRSVRYQRPLSIMIVDIDLFKNINDTHGHAAGDEVLRWFASECGHVIRQKVDVIGRYGGEEFAFLYPETDLSSALHAAGRLQSHFQVQKVAVPGHEIKVTFSAGVASLPLESKIELDEFIDRADKALYVAKQKRNCTAYWDAVRGIAVLVG